MPSRLALAVEGEVGGRRLGALKGGRVRPPPPFPMHPWLEGEQSRAAQHRGTRGGGGPSVMMQCPRPLQLTWPEAPLRGGGGGAGLSSRK